MIDRLRDSVALRFAAGLVLGWLTWTLFLNGGFALLKAVWPDYAAAAPDKAYTLVMLCVRLVIFSSLIAAVAAVATLVSGHRLMPWVAGGVILALSIPEHLYPGHVWDDYPAWYHYVYLVSIVPVALLGGRLARGLRAGDTTETAPDRREALADSPPLG